MFQVDPHCNNLTMLWNALKEGDQKLQQSPKLLGKPKILNVGDKQTKFELLKVCPGQFLELCKRNL